MLTLKRKKGQRIVIEYPSGDRVVVELCKVKPSEMRIGTDAPEHITITRSELISESHPAVGEIRNDRNKN